MREIKFKAYKNNKLVGTFTPLDEDLPHDLPKAVVWCQFTGLLDKAGKEIYEGDILRNDWNHNIFVVEWGEGEYPHQSDADSTNNKWNWKYGGCEVIGNIYEHPNLLQEEKGK